MKMVQLFLVLCYLLGAVTGTFDTSNYIILHDVFRDKFDYFFEKCTGKQNFGNILVKLTFTQNTAISNCSIAFNFLSQFMFAALAFGVKDMKLYLVLLFDFVFV